MLYKLKKGGRALPLRLKKILFYIVVRGAIIEPTPSIVKRKKEFVTAT